jgi:uncharacterized protein
MIIGFSASSRSTWLRSKRPYWRLSWISISQRPAGETAFDNVSKFFDRGRAYTDEKGIAHAELLDARLPDDMMTLVQQVQRASDTARLAAVRTGRVDNIAMPDRETTFEDP